MTTDVQGEIVTPDDVSGTRDERRARRIANLYASDAQFAFAPSTSANN
jgi:hypothetical protein